VFRLAAREKIPFLARMRFSHFRLGLLALIVALASGAPAFAAAARKRASSPAESGGTYRGAIVMDAASGKVLIEENADTVSPPASMTKLMTFAVLQDKIKSGALTLATPVTVTAADAGIGGTQVYLKENEVFSAEELIYAMMIQSANDAAYALARTAGGSVNVFVDWMNAKARDLGMTHTTFRTPHGLPPHSRRIAEGDLTSAHDFAILARYLLQNTDVLKYTSVRDRRFGEGKRAPNTVIAMVNHNKLLGKVAGVDGLKTGYTEGAGYCLAATAQRNGHRLIVVVMGSFGPNGQIDKGHARDLQTIELLERGFAALPPGSPAFAGAVPSAAPTRPAAAVSGGSTPGLSESSSASNASGSPIVPAPLTTAEKAAAASPAPGEPMIRVNVPALKK
jgi:D-alanyl-D-alanine carboxypeptidase